MKNFHVRGNNLLVRQNFKNTISEKLIRGVSFKLWEVDATDIEYQYDEGHTLSLYLKGGQQTYRYDKPKLKGQAGKLCIMPKGHLSRWHSGSPIRIAHLYLPDQFIRQEAERHLDIDSRLANLQDITYYEDTDLNRAMYSLISALNNGSKIDPLYSEEALYAVSSRLLERYRQEGHSKEWLNKGLSPIHRQKIKVYIKKRLETKMTLESLANLLHLSPFHFARMFKQSFGDSPANFIIRQRIELAKELLKGNTPLSYIALECGFSHQSHLNNHFKKHFNVTPALYRKLIKS